MAHLVRSVACSVGLLLLGAGLALADVQTILGSWMRVDDPLPGVNPSKRKVLVVARERLSPNTIVGDPIVGGATLQVAVNGATSTRQSFMLPPGPPPQSTGPGWTGKSIPGYAAKYLYSDKNGEASPVTKLALWYRAGRVFRIKAKIEAQGNNDPVDIVPGNPTSELGIVVTIGNGDSYCVLFGGAAGGDVIDTNPGKVVKAVRPLGEGCPEGAALGGCGNGVVDSDDEECDAPDDAACPGQCGTAEVPDGYFACLCKTKPRQRIIEHASTDLDLGWTGRGHDAGLVEGGGYVVDLSDCDANGDCIVGPSCSLPPHVPCSMPAEAASGTTGDSICADLGQGTCRKERTAVGPHCSLDIQRKCDPKLVHDPVCSGAGDSCVKSLHGPPLPLSTSGVSVCVVNVFSEDVVGTANVVTGTSAVRLRRNAIVHSGTDPANKPCPVCGGFCGGSRKRCDVDADCDANGPCITDAICSDGPNQNRRCRRTPPFGGPTELFGSPSVDCPPFAEADVSAGGLDLLLAPLTTGVTAKAPTVACDHPGFTNNVCHGGSSAGRPCTTAPECPGGSCDPQCFCPNSGSILQQPNLCDAACLGGQNDPAPCTDDSECPGGFCHPADCRADPADLDSAQEGVCTVGPFRARCSVTRQRPCTVDADCQGPACSFCDPAETCVAESVACFVNDGIVRQGAPGVSDRTTAGVFCMPTTGSSSVNGTFGFPGPGALTQAETTIVVP